MDTDRGKGPLVKAWLGGWLAMHREGRPGEGWPEPGSEADRRLWSASLKAFIAATVTEGEAREASRRMGPAPTWCEDHPAAIVSLVLAMRAEATAPPPEDRATAERLSRDCRHCQGSGQARIYREDYTGERFVSRDVLGPTGEVVGSRPIPAYALAHCTCPAGRWMRGRFSAEERRQVADLADVVAGRLRGWLATDPTGGADGVAPSRFDAAKVVVRVRDGEVVPCTG